MIRVWVALTVLLLALPACESLTPTTQQTQAPAGQGSIPVIMTIPTPSISGRATIAGFLLRDVNGPKPEVNAILYLAPLITGLDGKPALAALDRTSPLRTQTDLGGRFVFNDVPIEEYGLVLDRVTIAYLLHNPGDDKDLLLHPKPNEILDVGKLIYTVLPE